MLFEDRVEAGRALAAKLQEYQKETSVVVLAIPRGGVVIGEQVANLLKCPLEVIVIKKIPAPANPELAVGAVGPLSWGGEPVIDEELAERAGADTDYLKSKIETLKSELERRERKFRGDKPPPELKGKTVILTDDGVATGATMAMAVDLVRQQNPKKLVAAVPVISKDALVKIEQLADEVVYLEAPEIFFAVGQFYRKFDQISDEQVIELLGSRR